MAIATSAEDVGYGVSELHIIEAVAWLESKDKDTTIEVKVHPLVDVTMEEIRIGLHGVLGDNQYGGYSGFDKQPISVGDGWFQVGFTIEEISNIPENVCKVYPVVFFTPDGDYEKSWFRTNLNDALNSGLVVSLPEKIHSSIERTPHTGIGTELFLSHNPYRIKTVFQINNTNCDAPWFAELSCPDGKPTRLQMWIGKFFDKLHEAYPTENQFNLLYKGTSADCRDVSDEAARASERLGIEIVVKENPCGDPEDKFNQLRLLYDKAINGPYEGFHNPELKGGFHKVEDRLLQVAIMATMKNGKSTLLNAIMGQDLQPSATQRCTRLISYIEHCEGMPEFVAKCVSVDEKSSEYIPCDKAILERWNKDENIRKVLLRGTCPRMQVGDIRLQFVDTPGPNAATHAEDGVTIDHFLGNNMLPMVCYIVDILDNDEADYLKKIKQHMSQYGKQSEDRFIFVVTKMDLLRIDSEETFDHNQYKAKIEDIKAGLMRIGGISNPRIFPVSARIALKARSYNALCERDQNQFRNELKTFRENLKYVRTSLLDYTSVSSSIRNRIEAEIAVLEKKIEDDKEGLADQLRLAELQSGIPALEMAIEEYAIKYSVPARIYDAAMVFDEGIQKANAIELLAGEMAAQTTSLDKINQNIEQLNFFLSQGPAAQEMRTKAFPEEWRESQTLIDDLSAAEQRFDGQIKNELRNWHPQTLDANGNLHPDEACRLANSFVEFLNTLSTNMLRVYTRSVEEDAHKGFKKLQFDYQRKLGTILGGMPQELTDFLKRVPVLSPIESREIDAQALIEKSGVYEEYTHRYSRPITVEKDGVLRKVWSVMPFTDTEVMVEETRKRKREVSFVSYSRLVERAEEDASLILQTGLERALSASAKMYAELRRLMMKQFDRFDARLSEFRADLARHLADQQGKTEVIATYRDTLKWVRKFQEDLSHILNLEA